MSAINHELMDQINTIRSTFLNKFVEFEDNSGAIWFVLHCAFTTIFKFDSNDILEAQGREALIIELISVEESSPIKPTKKVMYQDFISSQPKIVPRHLQLLYKLQCEGIINDRNLRP